MLDIQKPSSRVTADNASEKRRSDDTQSYECFSLTSTTIGEEQNGDLSEGGVKAYLSIFGAFLALFCTFGQMNAFGTFQTYYYRHQLSHLTPSTISWIGSVQLWVFFFSGGPIGRLFDRYGPRYLMIAGWFCYVFSIMMLSICTKYYQYVLCQGILFGLGVGLMFYPSLASISTYFLKYRATALGIAAAGSSLGGVIYPIMLQRLFQKIGFSWSVRVSGLVSGVGCGISIMTVTTNIFAGQKPKGSSSFGGPIYKDKRFILLTAGSFLVALGLFIPFFYIVDYAHDLSVPSDMSFTVLAVMNAGGVFGRIAPAYLSDSIGRFNLLVPSAFLCGLSSLVLWLPAQSLVLIIVFSVIYGFFSGAFISVITPCIAQISDIREIGRRIGILYSVISFPALVGGPIAGALLVVADGKYTNMIVFSGASVITGSFFILGSKLMIDSRVLARV